MVKDPKHKSYKVQLGAMVLFNLKKRKLRGTSHCLQPPERRLYWFILVSSEELKTHLCFGCCWAGPPQHQCILLSLVG